MLFNTLALGFVYVALNSRISDLRDDMNRRFDAFETLWRAELLRVEGVIDARLRHLEEERRR